MGILLQSKVSQIGNGAALVSNNWKAVPDIWRYAAEKYGDSVTLVDPYHDPPTNMTYKELEQEILDFAEGLRVVGIKPDEKVTLFAENSCRWLVADQGVMATGAINVVRGSRSSNEEFLQTYKHSESVGLIVDNPEFYNRIEDTFRSKVDAILEATNGHEPKRCDCSQRTRRDEFWKPENSLWRDIRCDKYILTGNSLR